MSGRAVLNDSAPLVCHLMAGTRVTSETQEGGRVPW